MVFFQCSFLRPQIAHMCWRDDRKSYLICDANIARNLLTSPRSGNFFLLTDDNDMRWMRFARKKNNKADKLTIYVGEVGYGKINWNFRLTYVCKNVYGRCLWVIFVGVVNYYLEIMHAWNFVMKFNYRIYTVHTDLK